MDGEAGPRVSSQARLDEAHAPTPENRLGELDGLRGLAALAVVAYHIDERWFPLGWAAVDLFFVLSGFLITRIILQNGSEPRFLSRFYLRRGVRIWPAYYLAILALLAASRFLPARCNSSGVWYVLTYTQNVPLYWGGKNPVFHPSFRHTWTLAIEEQFYLVWPALLLVVRQKRVIPLACLGLVATVAYRGWGGSIYLLAGRLDGLALGALLAGLEARTSRTRPGGLVSRVLPLTSLLVGMTGLLAAGSRYGYSLAQAGPWPGVLIVLVNLAAFGLVGLAVRHAGAPWLAPFRFGPLRTVGLVSYGLYLYHGIILTLSVGSQRLPSASAMPAWRLVLTLLAIAAVTCLSWRYVERPLLGLKDRWPYREPAATRRRVRSEHAARAGSSQASV